MLLKKQAAAASTVLHFLFSIHYVTAIYDHSCPPSSCGSFTNISYPFRLKGDPPNCEDADIELTCKNGQTLILNLFSGEYHVKAIDYTGSTFQIVDVAVQDGNCSSLPLHSIAKGNFTDQGMNGLNVENNLITFISCETPQRSPLYVDSSACLATKNKYSYVVLDDRASSIGESCAIDLIFPAVLGLSNTSKVTYLELHKYIANGFVVSWFNWFASCGACRGLGGLCTGDSTTATITCSLKNNSTSYKALLSGVGWLLGQAGRYIVYGLHESIRFRDRSILSGLYQTPIVMFVSVRFICGGLCLLVLVIYKWRMRHWSMYDSIEDFLQNNNNLMPIRYSHRQIKQITNNFKEKLGEGGYGSVYKGKLRSGYLVAVKMLGKTEATGQDFMNEMATIGRIHHVNVVRLVGFCVEGSKRALVYDFMSNGSLDKYIIRCEGNTTLSWEKMYEISLGVARGIEYLHRGCEMQILHFDIKPHNILLDENFNPRVSDFGLAKLYPASHNTLPRTMARGTIGYIAPELINTNFGSVSHKADVYSFGMVLMNMAGKTKKLNVVIDNSSQSYFPVWAHYQIVNGQEVEPEGTEEEKRIAKKIVIVGMWCVQMNPTVRPSMNKILDMLEGDLESLEVPPKPSTYPIANSENEEGESTNKMWSSYGTSKLTESSSLLQA